MMEDKEALICPFSYEVQNISVNMDFYLWFCTETGAGETREIRAFVFMSVSYVGGR